MKKCLQTIGKWFMRLFLLLLVLLGISMISCSLPSLENRSVSHTLSVDDIETTRLGKVLLEDQREHPGLSGIYFLGSPQLAFAARGKLAEQADKTLDIQYYIWKNDTTGLLLLQAAYQAAERGVKVRLLLDDNGTSGLDDKLIALNAHPNIEVRLFNPFLFRPFKQIGYLTDFSRSNRRMHNKSFTVDNVISVVGGRNVGDEYFGSTEEVLFTDLDAIVIGEVVNDISTSFDEYWASESVYPIDRIVTNIDQKTQYDALQVILTKQNTPTAHNYLNAIRAMSNVDDLMHHNLAVHWVKTEFMADPASKGLHNLPDEQILLHSMAQTLGNTQHSLDVVSPYFVPTEQGTDYFVNLAKQGKQVRIVTNSMAATDVLPVHSGYSKYRKRLVEAGVILYEMKPDATSDKFAEQLGFLGSSGSSLHAKTFTSDQNRFFVGSFNFDPRSAKLNTELGIVIHDADIGAKMHAYFDEYVVAHSWQVRQNASTDQLEWHDISTQTVLTEEPHSNWLNRSILTLLSWLPIEGLL